MGVNVCQNPNGKYPLGREKEFGVYNVKFRKLTKSTNEKWIDKVFMVELLVLVCVDFDENMYV